MGVVFVTSDADPSYITREVLTALSGETELPKLRYGVSVLFAHFRDKD